MTQALEALGVWDEIVGDASPIRRMEITERIVGRLSLEYDAVCPEGLEHMLSQLSRMIDRTAPSAARSLI